MIKNAFYKILTAASLSAAMSAASFVPVYAQKETEPVESRTDEKSGIETAGGTLMIHSGTYSSEDIKDLKGKTVTIDGQVTLNDPLALDGTTVTIAKEAEVSVPYLTLKNRSVVTVNGKLTLKQDGTVIDDSDLLVKGGNSLLYAELKDKDELIKLNEGADLSVENGNIDLTGKETAVSGKGTVSISNDSHSYARFQGSGPVLDLEENGLVINSGSVYIEGATAPSYEQYANGNTHPGLAYSAVNANKEPVALFVVKENELPDTISVQGDAGSYAYQIGYQNGSADIWVPAAMVQYEGEGGTVDQQVLSDDPIAQPTLLIRGLSLKEQGFTLPDAEKPGMKFMGWQTENGSPVDENTVLSKAMNTLTAQYALSVVKVTVNYVQDGTIVGSAPFSLQENNPIVSADEISSHVPTGYELVSPAKDLNFASDGEVQNVEVKKKEEPVQDWNVSIQYVDEKKETIGTYKATVKSNKATMTADEISSHVPTGYELVSPAKDLNFASDEEVQNVEVKKKEEPAKEYSIELTFKDKTSHETVGKANFKVSAQDPKLTAEQIKAAVPEGYVLSREPEDTSLSADMFENGRLGLIYTVEKKADTAAAKENKKTTSNAKTAASVNAGLWIGLGAGAIVIIGILIYILRKKKN